MMWQKCISKEGLRGDPIATQSIRMNLYHAGTNGLPLHKESCEIDNDIVTESLKSD